jgi:hypothetical protein
MYLTTRHVPDQATVRHTAEAGDMAIAVDFGLGNTLYVGEVEAEQLAGDLLAAVARRRGEVVRTP